MGEPEQTRTGSGQAPPGPDRDDGRDNGTADGTAPEHDPVDPDRHDEGHIDVDAPETVEEQLRSHGVRIGRFGVSPAVFWPGLGLVGTISILAIIFPDTAGQVLDTVQEWIVGSLGWYYPIAIAIFIVFVAFMGLSRYGDIKLGREDEEPEFGVLSWLSMLFAAGMGIGLVFYGVAEPLIFAADSPAPGTEGSANELAELGMARTFMHWGLHPWAVYGVIGLALSYAIHRRGRPVSIRWALEPLLGERVKGWPGDVIDVFAILGTLFGVATSLGLGVTQIAAGLGAMGVVDEADNTLLVGLIAGITLLAIVSVVSGIGRGIKWLSNINLSLAGVLLIAVLLLGPTLFIFRNYVQSIGVYLAEVLNMTFETAAYTGAEGLEWQGAWTLFYWGWWISWAPFVGVFIARISRGRTVRQFVAGVLLVPTLISFLWFAVMGGTGIHRQLFGAGDLVDPEEGVTDEEALFDVLAGLPLGEILSVLAIILVIIFFVTSSDSGSLVIDMLASGGHPDPPTWSRVLWSSLEGLVAAGLLLAGGLAALQAGAISTALPFSVILLAMCVATYKAMRAEHRSLSSLERRTEQQELVGELSDEFDQHFGRQVDRRIDYRLSRTGSALTRGRSGRNWGRPDRRRRDGGNQGT